MKDRERDMEIEIARERKGIKRREGYSGWKD